MRAQIYKAFTEKYACMTESKETRNFIKRNFFKYGTPILNENEVIKKISGKELGIDAFVEEYQKMKPYPELVEVC